MKRYKHIHALVEVGENNEKLDGCVCYLLDSLKERVETLTILVPERIAESQRQILMQYTSLIYTNREYEAVLRKRKLVHGDKVLVFDECCFGPVDTEAFAGLLDYIDNDNTECFAILPGHCAMVRAAALSDWVLRVNRTSCRCEKKMFEHIFFNIKDLMDTDLNVSSCEKPGMLLEYLEHMGYDTNLIWEYLLSRYNIEDIKNSLHLEYIFSWKHSFTCMENITKGKAAIIAHLYYEEMVSDCFGYLRQIPPEIDVYITTSNQNTKCAIEKLIWNKDNYQVIFKENRGRDVSALLVACHDILLQYEYLGFVHDKKSASYLKYKSEVSSFNYNLWENMLKSENYIRQVLQCFEDKPKLGLLVPPEPYYATLMGYLGKSWGGCYEGTRKFAGILGLNCPMDREKLPITVSTTFWCRTRALKPLFSYPFCYEDFPEEPMSADGTFSHVIEHILAYVAQHQQFYTAVLMNDDYASLRGNGLQMLLIRALNEMRKEALILKPDDINEFRASAQKLLSFCGSYDKVYIFGAGTYGKRCYAILRNYYISIVGFLVSDGRKTVDVFEGRPVYQLSELAEEKDICGIIVALNKGNQKVVEPILDECGYRNRINIVEGLL